MGNQSKNSIDILNPTVYTTGLSSWHDIKKPVAKGWHHTIYLISAEAFKKMNLPHLHTSIIKDLNAIRTL